MEFKFAPIKGPNSEDMPFAWLIPKEALLSASILSSYGPGARFLEVGVLNGSFSLNLLRNCRDVSGVGIDPYPNLSTLRERLLARIGDQPFDLFSSFEELPDDAIGFDLIHIDGKHEEEAVRADIRQAWSRRRSCSSVMICDDIWNPDFPGVASAFFQSIGEFGIAPFLTTRSKVYCTSVGSHELWFEGMVQALSQQREIKWERYFGEGEDVAYVSNSLINGFKVLLANDRSVVGQRLIPSWPNQPHILDGPQLRD